MHSTLLIINSLNKTSGHSGQFQYSLNRSKFDVQAFRVNKVSIPYSFYNVVEQTYTVNSIVYNLPAGNYTVFNLISTILASVNVNLPSFNIVYSSITNKINITDTTPFIIDFQQIGRMLGFNGEIGPTTNITSEDTINLNLTTNLYISCQELGLYINSFFINKQSNVIQSIPININSYGYILFQNQMETIFKVDSRNLEVLNIEIFDDAGNIVFFNGQEVIIELELFSPFGFK